MDDAGGDLPVTLKELHAVATERLGARLERATPKTLAEFLTEVQTLLPGTQRGGTINVDGATGSYEEIMREYFADMLSAPAEAAAASLWITAAELWVDAVSPGDA
jgi:hypothetical protein